MGESLIEKAAQEIGKIIGQPIDPNLPVPAVLNEIADYETAEPGEEVKIYTAEDTNAGNLSSTTGDVIFSVGSNATITGSIIDPQTPAVIAFTSVQSRLERIYVDAILNSPDQSVIARRKAAITRAMDKRITKDAIDLVLHLDGGSGRPNQEVVQTTGMDLYALILAMKQKIEDFGDNYILLVGSTVHNKIESYVRDNATNFQYRVSLIDELLKGYNIKTIKVNGYVVYGQDNTTAVKVLAADKLVMVARDSLIAKGKPITYVRRKIAPAIAQMMGSEVDATFRATSVIPLPVNEGGANALAFGIHAFEQRVCALLNYRPVCWATYSA